MRIAIIASIFAAAVALAGCGDTVEQRAASGGLGGAVVGATIGAPITGAAVGAGAGALAD